MAPVFRTKFTELMGVDHPIMQGGMHYVGYASMAAAVSNAGGLGIITALTVAQGPDAIDKLRAEIRKCKSLTNKPFGVNITLLPVGVQPDFEGIIKCIIDEGVKIVETAGRNPAKVIKALKQAGIIVIHKCVAIRHAMTAARLGADMVSMDGFDCGGHPGEEDVGNWVLAPIAGNKLPIPFVVSGGCASGKQLVAALAMGAEGINIGTGFMSTVEAPIHEKIKQAIVDADERQTTHIFRTLNNTERVYKNKAAMQVREIEFANPGDFSKIAHLVKGENYRKAFQETGDTESGVWSCGQSLGLVDEVKTCEKFVKDIVEEAAAIIRTRLPSML